MQPSFPGILPVYGLTVLSLVSSVTADYDIDNANNTVVYAASGTFWRTFSFATQNLTIVLSTGNITVDSSKCYDQNYALAACTVENECQITIPFTGSGISVYVVQAGFQGVAASLKIDGGQPVTATLPPPTPPSYQTPNVSLFDIQFLPSAPHTATVNLLGWDNGTTSLYFDYAHINESHFELPTLPSSSSYLLSSLSTMTSLTVNSATFETHQSSFAQPTTASFTSLTTPTSTPTLSTPTAIYGPTATSATFNTRSSVNLGVILGSACGGLAAFVAIVTSIFFFKKRASRHAKLVESRRPDPFPTTPPVPHDQIASSPTYAPMNEKTRLHLATLTTAVSQARTQSADEASDFHIPLATGSASRVQGAEAVPSTTDPFSLDDFVIDCRREDGSFSSFRVSAVRDAPPPTAPPCYQTLDSEGANASNSALCPPLAQ